jgi:hypothetical protein
LLSKDRRAGCSSYFRPAHSRATESGQSAIDAVLAELASLPVPLDFTRLAARERRLQAAKSQLQDQDTALLLAAKQEASLQVELLAARARPNLDDSDSANEAGPTLNAYLLAARAPRPARDVCPLCPDK